MYAIGERCRMRTRRIHDRVALVVGLRSPRQSRRPMMLDTFEPDCRLTLGRLGRCCGDDHAITLRRYRSELPIRPARTPALGRHGGPRSEAPAMRAGTGRGRNDVRAIPVASGFGRWRLPAPRGTDLSLARLDLDAAFNLVRFSQRLVEVSNRV